ncbi:hypothetical protein PJK55_11135 [Exiguobacterium sp. MMG028]|uniref:hypothetical protein n=1 Tax=Exiguobacterium sp. MMG028 TaxID=3021979 RepID=UPI0022FE211C|nr:hypothetical protein [Exiguobacterium sp. MMG028]MDA5561291.1 hypothetical protein [Exiguobacterium sp. MMG028]
MIEGLPGSGKSTFAEKICALKEGVFYSEVDAAHPVDLHEVYWISEQPSHGTILDEIEEGWLVRYDEGEERVGTDVYELPFALHTRIMCERWRRYVKKLERQECDVIFECALLQNPFTIGMIAQDVSLEAIETYVQEVSSILKPIEPTIVYLELNDVARIFPVVYNERPIEWKQGFVEYYTTGSYASKRNFVGVPGTIAMLVDRQRLELELLERIQLRHVRIQNDERSSFERLTKLIEEESSRSCKP